MNTSTLNVLFAIATELANEAKSKMPSLCAGEQIISEEFSDGIYRRKTRLKGKTSVYEYNFKLKSVRTIERKRGDVKH